MASRRHRPRPRQRATGPWRSGSTALHERLQRDAPRFAQRSEHQRHAVRKRLKRLRYLSELVAPLYRKARLQRFLEALKPAQDELGRYMDLIVARELARAVVDGGDPRAWFDVGWLQARLPRAATRAEKALAGVAEARPFWRGSRERISRIPARRSVEHADSPGAA